MTSYPLSLPHAPVSSLPDYKALDFARAVRRGAHGSDPATIAAGARDAGVAVGPADLRLLANRPWKTCYCGAVIPDGKTFCGTGCRRHHTLCRDCGDDVGPSAYPLCRPCGQHRLR